MITSPWLHLAFTPSRWRVALAKLAMFFFPRLCQRTPNEATQLSRDRAHLEGMRDLELCHDIISARLFFATEKAGRMALEKAPELKLPLLLIHGADDRVTCCKATELCHERAGSADKTLIIYPDARHETHNDLGRERVLTDVCAWIGVPFLSLVSQRRAGAQDGEGSRGLEGGVESRGSEGRSRKSKVESRRLGCLACGDGNDGERSDEARSFAKGGLNDSAGGKRPASGQAG